MSIIKLNTLQKKAVENLDTHSLIIAGPGTGKTFTLTSKIQYLLRNQGTSAEAIVALTFTKRAAHQMEQKLKKISPLPFIDTFHAFCFAYLQERSGDIRLIDNSSRNEIIKTLAKSSQFSKVKSFESIKKTDLSHLISLWKINDYLVGIEKNKKVLIDSYNQTLESEKLLDYEDLLIKAHQILKHKPLNFDWILVDEFQDTNLLQYKIMKLLTKSGKLFVIGDPKQAVYAFRGSNPEIFERFSNDFAKVKVYNLEKNYRSLPDVVRASNNIFPESQALTAKEGKTGGEVKIITTYSDSTQADWIVDFINQKLGGLDLNEASEFDNSKSETTFSNFALLFRTHRKKQLVERRFIDSGIPYQIVGKDALYTQKEIRFLIDLLYLIQAGQTGEKESVDKYSKTVRKNSLYKKNIDLSVLLSALQNKNNEDLISKLLQVFKIRENIENNRIKNYYLYEFQNLFTSFEDIFSFIDFFENLAIKNYYDESFDKVTFISMHSAKGLEFDWVFICDFTDGTIPYTTGNNVDLEEERRLFYVSFTRAKKGVFLLFPKYSKDKKPISRFAKLIVKNAVFEEDRVIKKIQKRKEKEFCKEKQQVLF